jgi:hypothetical protein
MQVSVSHKDEQLARQIAVGLVPLCDALARRTDQDLCRLRLAPGVVVADFYAMDGALGRVAVGVIPLALVCASRDPDQLRRYAEQMVVWARRAQETQRLTLARPYTLN